MADSIFCFAIFYFLVTWYGKTRLRVSFSLVLQFVAGWLVVELAFFHAIVNGLLIVMAIGDLGDWSLSTFLGVLLCAYNGHHLWQLHQQAMESGTTLNQNLAAGLGENFRDEIIESRRKLLTDPTQIDNSWQRPFSLNRPGIETLRDITYGPNDRNTLDLHRPVGESDQPRPVMLQIHGGAWMIGYGDRQALPLRNKLVAAGWIFVAINYRLAPKQRFPAQLIDSKQALHWIKENIANYGGDPDFVMVTGGSAGGHLSSFLGISANQHTELLQPGFENADTSVQGCMPIYGVYDFCDRHGVREDLPTVDFLEKYIMPESITANRELWDIASPISYAEQEPTPPRPPFMVCHGELDTLAFAEDAHHFVQALQNNDTEPCVYAELETAQHGFEIFYSPRCVATVNALHTFAEWTYSRYLQQQN